ncbi:MAG TPA: HEPN domain-containing protein [Anaerolineales bacterium]|nr:HEPN domain-containing protein [Anaerolineales bacterium]
MLNVEKEVAYWSDTAGKDLQFASRLIAREDEEEILYSLFFLHLTLEKAFKAHVVKQTKKLPPRTHNLLLLAELGKINLSDEQNDFCGKINMYNIEARYPNLFIPTPTLEKAKEYLEQTKELMEWLIKQL